MKSGPYLGAGLKRILTIGAAAGLMLGSALAAGPASAETAVPRRRARTTAPPATSGISDAGLAEAVSRDLGLTPEEFNAAGELGRQAAAAAEALRGVPGYTGTRLQDGRILVSGSGPELEARVAELAATTPSLTLEPPAPEAAGGRDASPGPSWPSARSSFSRPTSGKWAPRACRPWPTPTGNLSSAPAAPTPPSRPPAGRSLATGSPVQRQGRCPPRTLWPGSPT